MRDQRINRIFNRLLWAFYGFNPWNLTLMCYSIFLLGVSWKKEIHVQQCTQSFPFERFSEKVHFLFCCVGSRWCERLFCFILSIFLKCIRWVAEVHSLCFKVVVRLTFHRIVILNLTFDHSSLKLSFSDSNTFLGENFCSKNVYEGRKAHLILGGGGIIVINIWLSSA